MGRWFVRNSEKLDGQVVSKRESKFKMINRVIGRILIAGGFSSLMFSAALQAAETSAISGVRFDPLEMHFGDVAQIELVPRERLGEMPVPILEDSGDGFVKILLPDGTEGWVNRTDVQMGGVEVEAICARFRIYSVRSDYGEAQLRGVSRDCD